MTDWDYIWLLFYGYVVIMVAAMALWTYSELQRMKALKRMWKMQDDHMAAMRALFDADNERAAYLGEKE